MKKSILIIAALFVAVSAFGQKIFSISTGPGEDASTQMGISWATDSSVVESWVLLARQSDRDWKKAVKIPQQQKEWFVAFDGMYSDDEKGNDFYENARFFKCGVMLSGLSKDTEYKYVICEAGGERSSEHHFRTAGAKKWSCCVISDFHSYPPLPGRLSSAMGMIDTMVAKDPSVSWILSPGDVVAWGGSYSFWKRYFEEPNVERFFWARVNGNHDNWTKQSQITRNFNISNSYFLGTSYFPHNGYEGEVGVCYHFRYGNTLFLMMNTEDLRNSGNYEDAFAWIREVVAKERALKNPPKFIVVCQHYEWFVGTDGHTSQYGRWHKFCDEMGIDLAIAGNNHVYVRTAPIFDGKVAENGKGTVYLVTSSSDNGRGRKFHETRFDNQDLIRFRWTEGSKTISAVHMTVDNNSISLELLDREGKVIDSTRIVK